MKEWESGWNQQEVCWPAGQTNTKYSPPDFLLRELLSDLFYKHRFRLCYLQWETLQQIQESHTFFFFFLIRLVLCGAEGCSCSDSKCIGQRSSPFRQSEKNHTQNISSGKNNLTLLGQFCNHYKTLKYIYHNNGREYCNLITYLENMESPHTQL